MEYAINQLTTIADCEALLEIAAMDRRDLDYKKVQQNHSYENVSNGSAGIEAELSSVQAQITSNETVISTLPEGNSTRKKLEDENVRLNYKKFLLTGRREKYGALALLEKQYDVATIEMQISENDAFVTAVKGRKEQL